MNRLIGLLLLASGLGFAALPSTTVWEVRPTVGSDSSGGCFDSAKSGTDYSQQNAAQFSGTNLVSVSSLVVSSVTHNFVATDVGNCINITAGTGFTTGFYEIVSVAANQATLDRSPGTVGVGGTWAEGGALNTVSVVNTNWTASNVAWVKATGTYTVTTALTITLDSHPAPATPASIIGYTSTRGDNGQFIWTTATNSIDLVDLNGSQNVLFQNIIFSSTAGTPGAGLLSGKTGSSQALTTTIRNCKFSGFVVGVDGNFTVGQSFVGLYIINSRFTANTSHGIRNAGTTLIVGSQSDNNGGDGFNSATTAPLGITQTYTFQSSVFYKNAGNGINMAFTNAGGSGVPTLMLLNCDVSTNTGAGVLMGNALDPYAQFNNSIFDANGTYGVDAGSGTVTISALLNSNAFFNNTTAPTRNINAGVGTITLTANPYTTIGTNFALNNTTGGGKLLKGAGFPGTIPNGGTGAVDVGALQTAGSAGGGQVGFGIIQ